MVSKIPRRLRERVEKCYELLELIGMHTTKPDSVRTFKYISELKSEVKYINGGDHTWVFSDKRILNKTIEIRRGHYPHEEPRPEVHINGETLLFRAVAKYKGRRKKSSTKASSNPDKSTADKDQNLSEIITFIIDEIPGLITFAKPGEGKNKCVGYSPLYLAIVKKHTEIVKSMIAKLTEKKIEVPNAEGDTFENSVMLASTPLGVAALTMDKAIFRQVLKLYYDLYKQKDPVLKDTKKNDNIIHSMIKYVHKHQDQLDEVKEMLEYILNVDTWKCISDKPEVIVRDLVRLKNKEQLSPLQLAAKRQQIDVFHTIMQNENYHWCNSDDGLNAHEEYDITELETIPIEKEMEQSKDEHMQKVKHLSVLEFVSLQQMNVAFKFVNCIPVREVIKSKWLKYRHYFYPWFFIHLILMGCLTVGAERRSRLQFEVANTTTRSDFKPVPNDSISLGMSVFGFCMGLVLLAAVILYLVVWCSFGRFTARVKSNPLLNAWRTISSIPYSNKIFGFLFVVFALLLVLDFGLAIGFDGYENQCLVFAIIIGWYLVLFFLQPIRRFSFFSVLIQQVIKDMINFAIIMGCLLIGFTVAMFMVMQGSSPSDDDFSDLFKALLKMFTVMLGIGEIGDLYNSRHPYLASFIFVLFVLLTTILLLNALIAMMSNSCTYLMNTECGASKTNKSHETLQKLSVIIFLESFSLIRFKTGVVKTLPSGERRRTMVKRMKRYSDKDMEPGDEDNPNIFHKLLAQMKVKKGRKKNGNSNSAVAPDATRGIRIATCEIHTQTTNETNAQIYTDQ